MREFQRWGGLMKESGIQKYLAEDSKRVVSEMIAELQKQRDDFDTKKSKATLGWIPNNERPPQYQNASPTVTALIWVRQYSQKITSNM
jgi:polyhydroxyalkanoate synthesis regulator phasin